MTDQKRPILEPKTQAFIDGLNAQGGKPLYSGEKVMLPAGKASKPVTKSKTQWLPPLSTPHGQNGSVPAAVAVLSRGPIFVEWLSINFCDLCTHARIDVGIATSDSMALRDVPHDSSVTRREIQNPALQLRNLSAKEFRCACAFISRAR
jgi:hypothetical protein